MCNSIVLNLSPTILRLKRCVKKLLKGSHMHYHLFPISVRPKPRYNKVVEKEPDSCNSSLITLRLTRCVKKLFHRCPYIMENVLDCYKTQEMCEKSIKIYRYRQKLFSDKYKTQEMFKSFLLWEPFMLKNCPDRYKTC